MKKLITGIIIVTMILILGISALAADSPVMYGDANGDGEVDNADIILTARYVVGLSDSINMDLADMNGDGEVGNLDLIVVAKYIVYGRHNAQIVLSAEETIVDKGSRGRITMKAMLPNPGETVTVYDALTKAPAGTLYDDDEDGICIGTVTVDTSKIMERSYYAVCGGYVKSQPEIVSVMAPLTDKDRKNLETVEYRLAENILGADNFVNLDAQERCTLADAEFNRLIRDNLLLPGSVSYDSDNYMYSYTYSFGRPGELVLGEPAGTYLKNGGFEKEPELAGWKTEGEAIKAYALNKVTPVKGDAMAMVSDRKDLGYISQKVTLPGDAATLSFYFDLVANYPADAVGSFTVEVISSETTKTLLSKMASSATWYAVDYKSDSTPYHTGWEFREYDISEFAGQTVTIKFTMYGTSWTITKALLDDIRITDCGISSCTAEDIVALARSQVGITEWPKDSNNVKYNTAFYGEPVYGSSYPWCCAFTWWLFDQNNANSLFYNGYRVASCTMMMNFAKENGLWISDPNELKPGDLLLYNFDSNYNDSDHIGVFIGYDRDGSMLAVEGNTGVGNDDNGGAVMIRLRYSYQLLGAYRPNYMEAPTVFDESYIK